MDIYLDHMVYFWVVLAIFFLIMEMGSPGLFFFISFFCGGIVAALSSFWCGSVVVQTALFLLATVGALVILYYWIVPSIGKSRRHERTNVYALYGKRGFVVVVITEKSPGMVKVNGEMWAARSVFNDTLEQGDQVEVLDVRGAHVIVKKI